ncbi:MAG: hypothetical protein HZY74_11515 [Brevundimonas sp.]|nr:MAG: hypothetical protein HZY74_11515 [Brevundimonas sp.]
MDGKRRLQIPQEFRTAVPGVQDKLMCLATTDRQCLEAGGDSLAALYMQRIEEQPFGSKARDALETAFFGGQRSLGYDSGGRITLPESLCQQIGLDKDVVIVGKGTGSRSGMLPAGPSAKPRCWPWPIVCSPEVLHERTPRPGPA